ncbi:MAG: TetR/AcrR family transcriptional regulator [Rhodobacteraceae bacterium]|nr:MAG: TetR/AcrR family transcriptional regulator [Paracoccaceae bacterium]
MKTQSITPRDRFRALDTLERARWLDPAEQEFCAHGFEAASMNRILANAGESKGRTYHYFADKGELFHATLERRLGQVEGFQSLPGDFTATNAREFWAKIAILSEALTRAFQTDTRLAALVRTVHQEPSAQAACAASLNTLRARIGHLITMGQPIGAVRRDLPHSLMIDVALGLVMTVDRWFAQNVNSVSLEDEVDISRCAFSLLMAPFLPQTDRTP